MMIGEEHLKAHDGTASSWGTQEWSALITH